MDNKTARSLAWASAFKASVALICFTVLAVVFHHWLLVFLSVLFMPSYRSGSSDSDNKSA